MTKRKLLESKLLVFGLWFCLFLFVTYQTINAYAYQRFRPNIAECRNMDTVVIIVAGRLRKPDKKVNLFANYRKTDQTQVGPSPKPIYTFMSKRAYKGIYPRTRGNIRSGFNFRILEGEAPQGALGKRALICIGGFRPRTLEAIYIQQ